MRGFLKRLGILGVWGVTFVHLILVMLYVNPLFGNGRDGDSQVDLNFATFIFSVILLLVVYLSKDKYEEPCYTTKQKLLATFFSPWTFHMLVIVLVFAIIVSLVSIPYWLVTGRWLWRQLIQ